MSSPRSASAILSASARRLDAPMREPFEIASARRSRVENVLVSVRLADGTAGFGECAPLDAFSGETQATALKAAREAAERLPGQDAARPLPLARRLEEELSGHPSVRAGVEMAVLDARARQLRTPLWACFGGASDRVTTDVTVTILPPGKAAAAARRLARQGIRTIKIKVGREPEEDLLRVLAVAAAAPRARLLVDANQGYDAGTALRLLRRLRARGVRPALFEQPVPKGDLEGMAKVLKDGGIPVAADESASCREDVWRLARKKAASVVNVKLMKLGVAEALDAARAARAAGLGLMMGGMIESRLAMGCAAHFAAGLGGFEFIDLDTSLWLSRDPMAGGPRVGPGGLYDLSRVRAGIGVRPRAFLLPAGARRPSGGGGRPRAT